MSPDLNLPRYGGIFERGSREYTLDDFYALQLDKMDRYVCLKESGVVVPTTGDLESSDDEDEDDEDDDGEDDDDDDPSEEDEGPETPKEEASVLVPEDAKSQDVSYVALMLFRSLL